MILRPLARSAITSDRSRVSKTGHVPVKRRDRRGARGHDRYAGPRSPWCQPPEHKAPGDVERVPQDPDELIGERLGSRRVHRASPFRATTVPLSQASLVESAVDRGLDSMRRMPPPKAAGFKNE